MDFKEATDRLTARVTLTDVAEACRAHPNSIDRARLEPGTASYRNPPRGWREAVMRLARERAAELDALANLLGESSGNE